MTGRRLQFLNHNTRRLFYKELKSHLSISKMITEGAPAHGTVAHLLPPTYKRLIAEWLEEDTPSLDYGGFVVGEEISEAKLLGKSKVR